MTQAEQTWRDTTKARAARTLIKRRRWAAELRAAGWAVVEPGDGADRQLEVAAQDLRIAADYTPKGATQALRDVVWALGGELR